MAPFPLPVMFHLSRAACPLRCLPPFPQACNCAERRRWPHGQARPRAPVANLQRCSRCRRRHRASLESRASLPCTQLRSRLHPVCRLHCEHSWWPQASANAPASKPHFSHSPCLHSLAAVLHVMHTRMQASASACRAMPTHHPESLPPHLHQPHPHPDHVEDICAQQLQGS